MKMLKKPVLVAVTSAVACALTFGALSPSFAQERKTGSPGPLPLPTPPSPPPAGAWYFEPVHPGVQPTMTNISGKPGKESKLLNAASVATVWKSDATVAPPKVVAITSLAGREKTDKPVQISIGVFNTEYDTPSSAWRRIDVYNHMGGSNVRSGWEWKSTDGNDSSMKVLSVQGYVHGIQVCLNNAETRLKGVKVLASALHDDGVFRRDPALQEVFERPNCSKWQNTQLCPVGQIAVGARVHSEAGAATGIALQCQAVKRVLPTGVAAPTLVR